jgi:murein L,D-transpeptidase YafK
VLTCCLAGAHIAGSIAVSTLPSSMMENASEDRVAPARKRVGPILRQMHATAGIRFPARRLYIRAFKHEQELEVWCGETATEPLTLLKTYKIAGMSGTLGPKRKEGDLQVPEGFYFIDRFNPQSRFHLSLGINYPNSSDRILSDPHRPGGDIFIHGDTRSIGCLAMTDPIIEEIYILALNAKSKGQSKIPVHIFPFRMSPTMLASFAKSMKDLVPFWTHLKRGYDAFEASRTVPNHRVSASGEYKFSVD